MSYCIVKSCSDSEHANLSENNCNYKVKNPKSKLRLSKN